MTKKELMASHYGPDWFGVYSIYDIVAHDGCPPFTAKNDGVAQRQFQGFLRDLEENQKNANPLDYRLYHVGQWNPEKMILASLDTPGEVFNAQKAVEDLEGV